MSDKYGSFFWITRKDFYEKPVISVIMAVYNGYPFVMDAIDSVLGQQFKNFEFLIVNDGSTDETSKILENYLRKDRRLSIIIQPNIGLTKSLNRGLILSKGKYIARIDHDDIWVPQKLSKQIAFLKNNPDIFLVGTDAFIISDKGEYQYTAANHDCGFIDHSSITRQLVRKNPFVHSSVMFRRQIINSIGLYNDNEKFKFVEDYEYWIRILSRYNCAILNEKLTGRRIHDRSIGRKHRRQQAYNALLLRIQAVKNNGLHARNFFYILANIIYLVIPTRLLKYVRWVASIALKTTKNLK